MELRKPKHQIIDGVPRCVLLDPDILKENLKFVAQAGDVVQSTFPKSGSHWVQFIIQLILKKGEPITTYREFTDNMRLLEYSRCQDWTPTLPLRTFFSHLPLSRDVTTAKGKYVYVARNPWDVCVSFYHYVTKAKVYGFSDGTFEEFVDAFVGGNFGYGDYFEHVAAGYALRNEANVFFVTYEQLLEQKRSVVLRLAQFLGEEYGKALEENDELLKQLLERSTAESMRNILVVDLNRDLSEEWQEVLSRNEHTRQYIREGNVRKFPVVRAAMAGGWREHFTPEQLLRMELRIREAEKKSAFMELWKDIRAEAIEASNHSIKSK